MLATGWYPDLCAAAATQVPGFGAAGRRGRGRGGGGGRAVPLGGVGGAAGLHLGCHTGTTGARGYVNLHVLLTWLQLGCILAAMAGTGAGAPRLRIVETAHASWLHTLQEGTAPCHCLCCTRLASPPPPPPERPPTNQCTQWGAPTLHPPAACCPAVAVCPAYPCLRHQRLPTAFGTTCICMKW